MASGHSPAAEDGARSTPAPPCTGGEHGEAQADPATDVAAAVGSSIEQPGSEELQARLAEVVRKAVREEIDAVLPPLLLEHVVAKLDGTLQAILTAARRHLPERGDVRTTTAEASAQPPAPAPAPSRPASASSPAGPPKDRWKFRQVVSQLLDSRRDEDGHLSDDSPRDLVSLGMPLQANRRRCKVKGAMAAPTAGSAPASSSRPAAGADHRSSGGSPDFCLPDPTSSQPITGSQDVPEEAHERRFVVDPPERITPQTGARGSVEADAPFPPPRSVECHPAAPPTPSPELPSVMPDGCGTEDVALPIELTGGATSSTTPQVAEIGRVGIVPARQSDEDDEKASAVSISSNHCSGSALRTLHERKVQAEDLAAGPGTRSTTSASAGGRSQRKSVARQSISSSASRGSVFSRTGFRLSLTMPDVATLGMLGKSNFGSFSSPPRSRANSNTSDRAIPSALRRAMTRASVNRNSIAIHRVEEARPAAPAGPHPLAAVVPCEQLQRAPTRSSFKTIARMSAFSGTEEQPDQPIDAFHTESQLEPWDISLRRNAVSINPDDAEALLRAREARRRWRCRWPFADPHSAARLTWDYFGFMFFALQMLYLPFRFAFIMDESEVTESLLAVDNLVLFIDFFWVADLLMNFTTGFYSMQVLQLDPKLVARRYLRSWFVIDLIATLPRPLSFLLDSFSRDGSETWYLKAIVFLRILRLPRLARMMSLLQRTLKSREVSSFILLCKPFVLLVVISHCTACALWAVGRNNLEDDPSRNSWIKDGLMVANEPGALRAFPLRDRYICAMYFSLTVMSTVGLGDITAKLSNERSLLMVLMIVTSVVVGVAVNGVSQFVAKMGEHSKVTNEHLVKASNFMKWYSVPPELQSRVNVYLHQFFENQDREEVKKGLMEWIKKSDVLRADLNLALTGHCLARHRLLGYLPRHVLVEICDMCEMVFNPPGEVLQSPGSEVLRCIYIRAGSVSLGDVEKFSTQQVSLSMNCQCGNVFMDDAVFCRKCGAKRNQASTGAQKGGSNGGGRSKNHESEVLDIDEATAEDRRRWEADLNTLDAYRPSGILKDGSFLGDLRLFVGTGTTRRTAKCTSFCELISLDVLTFRQRLNRRHPELLHALAIYASIEVDCAHIMAHGIETWDWHPDETLLAGEAALHDCARRNSPKCAEQLLALGASVEAVDGEDLTASQIAAALRHRGIFRILVLAGARTKDEEVLPPERQRIPDDDPFDEFDFANAATGSASTALRLDHSVKLDNSVSAGEDTCAISLEKGMEAFRRYLERHDVWLGDSARYGTKGVQDLYLEMKRGECTLETLRGRRLRRKVILVRVRLLAIVGEEVRALVELESENWLKSPACRVARLPSRRVCVKPTCDYTAETEELLSHIGLTSDFIVTHLAHVSRCTYVEVKSSMSYPGLETQYTIVETCLRIRRVGVEVGGVIGLPEGLPFERNAAMRRGGLQPVNENEDFCSLASLTEKGPTESRVYFWTVSTSVRTETGKETESQPSARRRSMEVGKSSTQNNLEQAKDEGLLNTFKRFGVGRRMSLWSNASSAAMSTTPTRHQRFLRMTMTIDEDRELAAAAAAAAAAAEEEESGSSESED